MRIITRPDFDGIVCAVLLYEALDIKTPVLWVEPNDMQNRNIDVQEGDIIANLAYHENCLLWFDHHESNRITVPFYGSFEIAPSAAGVVFDFCQKPDPAKLPPDLLRKLKPFKRDFRKLSEAADKIDSADLTPDEVEHPGKYPFVALSMSIISCQKSDVDYWNRLVELLRQHDIRRVLEDTEVAERCSTVETKNKKYAAILKKYTVENKKVTVTDYRSLEKMPNGNRFLVFSLFPRSVVNVRIGFSESDKDKIIVSVGHSIFNRKCKVSAGRLCARFGGGGHRGAGSCSFHKSKADEYIPIILKTLENNHE